MYKVALETSHFPSQNDMALVDKTVGDILRDAAAAAPDDIGLVEGLEDGSTGRRWTFSEMLRDSLNLAHWLAARYQKGDRVAVWSPNSPEWILLEFACGLAGITLVTVNPSYQPKELDYVLRQSGAIALFLIPGYRGNPMAETAEEVCEKIDPLKDMVFLDGLLDRVKAEGGAEILPDVSPDDPAQIQYTSGTTGFPKGALLHHKGMVNNSYHEQKIMGLVKGARVVTMMPLFHCAGCVLAVLGSVQTLATNIIIPIFNPMAINRVIEEERVSFIFGVPTMLIALLEDFNKNPRDFSSVSRAGSGGSMVPPELVRRIIDTWKCAFITIYGQTETSPVISMTRAGDTIEDISNTIGQPLPHVEVAIRDNDKGTIMPLGEQGEITTRGYLNMIGYNNNPEATANTIDKDGWLRTGDLGTMDARGYVRITGRVKEMIIRGGENLFPAEIENCLLEHPDVLEIAVVGLPDDKWGEIVGAFIRLKDGVSVTSAELKAHCRAHISPQKTPTEWHFVSEFPLTGSGKIRRFKLRDMWLAGDFS